jgi:HSP20 family molecular chaperone IbpA
MEDHPPVKSRKTRPSLEALKDRMLETASLEEKRQLLNDLLSPSVWDDFQPACSMAGVCGGSVQLRFDKKENAYMVEAPTPGVSREELKIELVGEARMELTIEQPELKEDEKPGMDIARPPSKFVGFCVLPEDASTNDVVVHYANGLLRVRFLKLADNEKKQHQSEVDSQHGALIADIAAKREKISILRAELEALIAETDKLDASLKHARMEAARERSSKRRRLY